MRVQSRWSGRVSTALRRAQCETLDLTTLGYFKFPILYFVFATCLLRLPTFFF